MRRRERPCWYIDLGFPGERAPLLLVALVLAVVHEVPAAGHREQHQRRVELHVEDGEEGCGHNSMFVGERQVEKNRAVGLSKRSNRQRLKRADAPSSTPMPRMSLGAIM